MISPRYGGGPVAPRTGSAKATPGTGSATARQPMTAPQRKRKEQRGKEATMAEPVVGVIMGSDSDWATMSAAAQALDEFDVAYEVRVLSAHRTPEAMIAYARSAAGRGLRVIVAGAGGAAALPG